MGGDGDGDLYQFKGKRTNFCDDSDENLFLKLSDKSVLDCPNCFHPLTIPVFQCSNGHVACSSCHARLKTICTTCSTNLGNIRNKAIENVIESTIATCSYKAFGCAAEFAYSTKQSHEENCCYAPHNCLFKDCNFTSSFTELYHHLKRRHSSSVATLNSIGHGAYTLSKAGECIAFLGEEEDNNNNKRIVFLNLKRMEISCKYNQGANLCEARECYFLLTAEHKLGSFEFKPVIRPWCELDDDDGVDYDDGSIRTNELIRFFYQFYDKGRCLRIKLWVFL